MKTFLGISFFVFLCSIIPGIASEILEQPDGSCWTSVFQKHGQTYIRCVALGIDGRSFEQALGETIPSYAFDPAHLVNGTNVPRSELYLRNVSINEIAHLVVAIFLDDSRNVTLGENALAPFANLDVLRIEGPERPQNESIIDEQRGRLLNLSPGAFLGSKFYKLELVRVEIDDESIRALLKLKERLSTIVITDVSPEDKMFAALSQFTYLSYVKFTNCSTRPFPTNIIPRFPISLQMFEVDNCYFPRLPKGLFANFTHLLLKRANLTYVEPAALDQNPNMWRVDLRDNDLPSLPEGLFSKLTNLRFVVLEGNPRLNGSIDRSNFTHGYDFDNFDLEL